MSAQPVQMPAKQVIYNGTVIDAQPSPDGGVMLVISAPANGELLVFPMSAEVGRVIGQKLCAPRVEVAGVVPINGSVNGSVNGNGRGH